MKLNQAEIIQILRKRVGMNQGEFGARAFNTSVQSGRTKIKNIELGKQMPSQDDLENMARVLGLSVASLLPKAPLSDHGQHTQGIWEIDAAVLHRFPGLDVYLDLLSKAATLEDTELIDHIAAKICELLGNRPSLSIVAPGEGR